MTDTISIGIDLGTTNSATSVINGSGVKIVKNFNTDQYTPSVFGIDPGGNKRVGQKPYDKLFQKATPEERKNNKEHIKRAMGSDESFDFPRADQEYTPEEISAEILKSLRRDIERAYPDIDMQASVITIPASFSTVQAEATKRAGQIAGFDHCVLLQEPIAAAMAYGFKPDSNQKALVYDLGGGTFDAALITAQNGELNVMNHHGDNFLGGRNFDEAIVDEVILPHLYNNTELSALDQLDIIGETIKAKLLHRAKEAKVHLSQVEQTTIEVDIEIDKSNKVPDIYELINFTRDKFEELITPLVNKTIEHADQTISESGVDSNQVDRAILVGGSTLIPLVRKKIKSKLGLSLDTSVNPMTAIARGAGVFARSQALPDEMVHSQNDSNEMDQKTGQDVKTIDLEYEQTTPDMTETVAGVINGLDPDKEYTLQLADEAGEFRLNSVPIENDSFFVEGLPIDEGVENTFHIHLFDENDESVPVSPDSFTITHGMSVGSAPLPHSIGVAITKQKFDGEFNYEEVMDRYFEKGQTLPLEDTKTYSTVRDVKAGNNENVLPIKVYEGKSEIPDRNTFVCNIKVSGQDIPYDLPEGAEVEVTISVDESRNVEVDAYVPTHDVLLDARATMREEEISVEALEKQLTEQQERYESISNELTDDEQKHVKRAMQDIQTAIKKAPNDNDNKRKARSQVKELKQALDEIEEEKSYPRLKEEFWEWVERTEDALEITKEKHKPENAQDKLNTLRNDGQDALDNSDRIRLKQVIRKLKRLEARILRSNPQFLIRIFDWLKQQKDRFTDSEQAAQYITEGDRALEKNNYERLEQVVLKLGALLPEGRQKIPSDIAGITR